MSSFKEKLGQILMLDFRYWGKSSNGDYLPFTKANELVCNLFNKYNLGGFILFKENIENNQQVISLLRSMQNSAKTPLFFGIDQEGGKVNRISHGTSGCGNMALSATNDPNNAYTIAKIIGDELYSLGININFAPVIDVNSNKNNPIIGVRSFSDNPKVVSKYAKQFIKGLSDANMISCVKHFPGHGDTSLDTHKNDVILKKTLTELEKTELYPFRDLINSYDMIMTAHISLPNLDKTKYKSVKTNKERYVPATLSHNIITKFLKENISFDGLVISDAMDMKAISSYFSSDEAMKLAITAGIDVLLMPIRIWGEDDIYKLEETFSNLEQEYNNNKNFAECLNKAYEKVIKFKKKHKLNKNPIFKLTFQQQVNLANKVINSTNHQNTALKIAKKSTTVVKNNGLLPYKIKNTDTVLIIDSDNHRLENFIQSLKSLVKLKNLKPNIITKNIKDNNLEKDISLASVIILISANLDKHSKLYTDITSIASEKTINIAALNPYDINYIDNVKNYICIYGATSIDQTNYTKASLKLNIIAALENIFDENKSEFNKYLPVQL